MGNDGTPFRFTLTEPEVAQIMDGEINGSGGLQSLLRDLQGKLAQSPTVEFDNAGLGQLLRYMCTFGHGTFQKRLYRAFIRPVNDLLYLGNTP